MPSYHLQCETCPWHGELSTTDTEGGLQALLDDGCPACGGFVQVAPAQYGSISVVSAAANPKASPLKKHNPGHVGCCNGHARADALLKQTTLPKDAS
jgi:hypothetical protein